MAEPTNAATTPPAAPPAAPANDLAETAAEPKVIEHRHDGSNKTFEMAHPKHGKAIVGDWQLAEFQAAGWKKTATKLPNAQAGQVSWQGHQKIKAEAAAVAKAEAAAQA